MSINIMEQVRVAFRAEALDLLIELDSALLSLEAEPGDRTLVNRVFRAIHTIKGSGGTAGLVHLARFTHNVEEAFERAREGRLSITPELIDCALQACDVIKLIVDGEDEGGEVPGEADVVSALALLSPPANPRPVNPSGAGQPQAGVRAAFEIVFKPNREIFYSGADPVTLLDELRQFGQLHITTHIDQIPCLSALEAEHCYLWWDLLLVSDRAESAIREVFVFVEDECEVRIRLLDDQASAVSLLGSVPAESLELFVTECEERLEAIERDALALEEDPGRKGTLDSLFRGIHSIKGNAGLLLGQVKEPLAPRHPLQLLLRVAHGLESLLDPFRTVPGPLPAEAIQTSLETCDEARKLLANLTDQAGREPLSSKLLQRLGVESATALPDSGAADGREAAFFNTTSQCVEVIAGCLRRMESDGESSAPVLQTYLRTLKSLSSAIQYRKCSELEEPVARQLRILSAAVKTSAALDEGDRSALSGAFQEARSILERMSPERAGSGIPETAIAQPPPEKSPAERPGASGSTSTLRVEQNKLDRLMRVVGELLVARGAVPLLAQKLNSADNPAVVKDLKEAGSTISRIADELQATVMSIRMLPVKTVFQKFPRLVRDLARSLGKEVRLVIEGEGIELDKTILEQIGDPLVHVIRNAVDHGLEPPAERQAKGKDASGQLILRAEHESGGVTIEVTDDGRGLDPMALKRKAVEKGLLKPEAAAAMSDEAAFQLIFLPGLTTAAKLTDVSGRGVGMDVVRSNIANLQGRVEIRSQLGRGASFLIKLPTSLLVSKGILLEAGAQEYILPLSNIRDMVKLPRKDAHRFRGLTLVQVRGTIYSTFSLAESMGLTPADTAELSIAIVEAGTTQYGLVVDRFVNEVEVLVKPLTGGLERSKEFQGAAIMGDGRVVLVLNVAECRDAKQPVDIPKIGR